ncbi:MAG: FISUMP domain-containing protein [Fibrobacterota bacterium]
MKPASHLLLALPAIALCANLSGTATLLDGTPIAGAVAKIGTDSVITTANGAFSLDRSTGLAKRHVETISVTRNLSIENGRIRLSFSGTDIAGRGLPPRLRQIPSSRSAESSYRFLSRQDTLRIYWKGKRLTELVLPTDTGDILLRIDTAWSDDDGIPWNPAISYGSVRDSRDARVYRTISMGGVSWMAENLTWAGIAPEVFGVQATGLERYGRHYPKSQWNDALCPDGWRLPHVVDWNNLTIAVQGATGNLVPAGTALKSRTAWDSAVGGSDAVGFRGLPGGMVVSGQSTNSGKAGFWALDRDGDKAPQIARLLHSTEYNSPIDTSVNTDQGVSIRCMKDVPAIPTGTWKAQAVLGSATTPALVLTLQDDELLLTEGTDTLIHGVVAERRWPRIRLAPRSGKLYFRNPDGWVRLDTSGSDLFFHMISRHLAGSVKTGNASGNWAAGPLPSGGESILMRSDSTWVRTQAASVDSGSWKTTAYPDAQTLRAAGIDSVFSAWIAGKPLLSVASDPYLYELNTNDMWLDLTGDDAFARFRRDP